MKDEEGAKAIVDSNPKLLRLHVGSVGLGTGENTVDCSKFSVTNA